MECHTLPVDLKPQTWSDEGMNRLDQLATLLRFPSISAQKEHARDVSDCADWLVDKLSGMGLEAKACKTPLHPIVLARSPREEGKPTVLIYGHYDVQPVDPVELWESDPFEPEVRGGKIYARGATDNKGQLFAHILGVEELLRQNGGHLPVNVIFLLEGEEEVGSGSLSQFIKEHREDLACDVIVVSDTGMAAPDTPTFSYGLRGLAGAEIIVKGPSADLHSGVFGGAVANPIAALAEIIASFHDEEGRVAVRGFYDGVEPIATWERSMWATVPCMSNEELAQLTGVETVVTEAGFTGAECIFARPTLEINGIGGGYQGEGSKTIIPSHAFAKISCRLVPGQQPERIETLLEEHVKKHSPKGVTVEFRRGHGGNAYVCDPNSEFGLAAQQALEEAFGRKPVLVREGGSIPIIEEMKRVLGADALMLGMCLPDARIHSPNENFPVDLFSKGIDMSQILLRRLGQIKH